MFLAEKCSSSCSRLIESSRHWDDPRGEWIILSKILRLQTRLRREAKYARQKRVCRLPELLQVQQLEYLKYLYNENDAELSKEFGDVFRIWLASKPTAAEGPDVHLAADAGVLPYREKSVAARNSKFKVAIYIIYGYD